MNFDVNKGNVDWVVRNLNSAMGNGQFSSGEVVVGLAQFTAALIQSLAPHPMNGFQVAQALGEQIKNAMVAGYTAAGYDMKGESNG
jgi:hypothetical protein